MVLVNEFAEKTAAGIIVHGRFLPLAFSGDVTEEAPPAGAEFISDEQVRFVQRRADWVRSWKVSSKVSPAWNRNIQRVRAGMFGQGPFPFYNPRSATTNALRSGFSGEAFSFVEFEGELIPVHFGSKLSTGRAVVRAGTEITGSAVINGTGQIALTFYDASGAYLSAIKSTTNPNGTINRIWAVAETPGEAVTARIIITNGTTGNVIAGAPQINLGTVPGPIEGPQGIGNVTIEFDSTGWSGMTRDGQGLIQTGFTAKEAGLHD